MNTVLQPSRQNGPAHSACARALCFLGRNLGLGHQSRAGACAHLGRSLARSTGAVRFDPMAERRCRRIKTPRPWLTLKP